MSSNDASDSRVRAVLFEEQGWWVAQCLEVNVATQARTLQDLQFELERILVGYLVVAKENDAEPFENLRRAPKRFWRMYEEGSPVQTIQFLFHAPRGIPEVTVPELELRAA